MTANQYPALLVVEDSDEDFEALNRIIQRICSIDIPMVRCVDGEDALDFLYQAGEYANHNEAFDLPGLILLDLNLPGTDGREVLAQIKQDERLKIIPVIVFTTSSSSKDIEICYQSGVNSYMIKPIGIEPLKNSVQFFVNYWFKAVMLPNGV